MDNGAVKMEFIVLTNGLIKPVTDCDLKIYLFDKVEACPRNIRMTYKYPLRMGQSSKNQLW